MPVGAGSGSLEARVSELGNKILSSPDDWEARNSAVLELQQLVIKSPDATAFDKGVWRALKEPLQYTLQDLRSSLVREACKLLTLLAERTGDGMRPLMRDLVVLLLQLAGSANGVIQEYVDAAFMDIIHHARFPRQIKDLIYEIRNSRSKDVREIVAKYLLLILEQWPQQVLDREVLLLQDGLQILLEDASPKAREIARQAFPIFLSQWPQHGEKILEKVDIRTSKLLRAAVGDSVAVSQSMSMGSLTATSRSDGLGASSSQTLNRSHSARDVRSHQMGHSRAASGIPGGNVASETEQEASRAVISRVSSHDSTSLSGLLIDIGDRVTFSLSGQTGTVRFKGSTQFASGIWVGVELDNASGKNNGSVNGTAYFSCKPDSGVFVRPGAIEKLKASENDPASAAGDLDLFSEYKGEPVSEAHTQDFKVQLDLLGSHKHYLKLLLETLKEDAELVSTLEKCLKAGQPLARDQVEKYHTATQRGLEFRSKLGKELFDVVKAAASDTKI